ncbi:MAG: hypothetical protein E5X59_35350, partial [Mesorhizobium sp.]
MSSGRDPFPGVGAAPHLPAGILSPYSDGERDAVVAGFAKRQRCKKGAETAASFFLPVTIHYRIHTSRLRFAAKLDSIS